MKIRVFFSILAAAVSAMILRGAEPRLVLEQQSDELRRETAKYRAKTYRYGEGEGAFRCLMFPPSGRNYTRKGVPMVVYIPGCGERGDPIRQFRQRAVFDKVLSADFQKKSPCYLLAVSPPESARTLHGGMPGRPSALQRTLHDMIVAAAESVTAPRVDRDRIYLTGFSYGGSGVYALALHYPGEYAAAMPIAGLPPLPEYFSADAPGNFWHFHNEGDYERHGISPKGVEKFRDMVNAGGGDFRIGTYSADKHDAWTSAWREDEAWKWMFSKRLGGKGPAGSPLAGAKCSASVAGQGAGSGPERAIDGLDSTYYMPKGGFSAGDWWMVELSSPTAGSVSLHTGDSKGEWRLSNAVVEVSMNGKTWTRAGAFQKKDGACTFKRTARFRFIRIRAQSNCGDFRLRRVSVTRA